MKEIVIDGIKYISETEVSKYTKAEEYEGMKYCIVRTYSAGVFAGYGSGSGYGYGSGSGYGYGSGSGYGYGE